MDRRWHRKRRALKLALINLGAPKPFAFTPISRTTAGGVAYDLYEPKGTAESTHILLYGMDYAGEKDYRLVRFARSYAASGIRVAIPVLPGLKSFQVDSDDLERIVELTERLHEQFGTAIRYTGFSIGGGFGLVAAARTGLAEMVDLLLLFSPPYALADLWQAVESLQRPNREDKLAWESFVMGKTAVAYHQIDSLGLTQEERNQFLDLLDQHCERKAEVSDFYDRVLAHRGVSDFSYLMPDETTMARLSPAGKLHSVKARVLLLHDVNDPTSPPENPKRIMAELPRLEGAQEHRMLITPLFSHVTPRVTTKVGDAIHTLDILSELFT